jgi:hypothetical protein
MSSSHTEPHPRYGYQAIYTTGCIVGSLAYHGIHVNDNKLFKETAVDCITEGFETVEKMIKKDNDLSCVWVVITTRVSSDGTWRKDDHALFRTYEGADRYITSQKIACIEEWITEKDADKEYVTLDKDEGVYCLKPEVKTDRAALAAIVRTHNERGNSNAISWSCGKFEIED